MYMYAQPGDTKYNINININGGLVELESYSIENLTLLENTQLSRQSIILWALESPKTNNQNDIILLKALPSLEKNKESENTTLSQPLALHLQVTSHLCTA